MAENRVRRLLRPRVLVPLLLAGLVCLELGVRALDASRGYSTYARSAWYWLFEQDPLLGYRGRPYATASLSAGTLPAGNADSIQHGPDGFRDERSLLALARTPGRRLVVCVGDANTYGLNAGSNDLTYPAALEKELRALSTDDRWHVFNAGMPGYTSHEILELVKLRLLKAKPDVIVFMSLVNDHDWVTLYLDDALDYDFYPIRMASLSRTPLHDFLMRSVVVGRIADRWRARVPDDLGGRYPTTAYGEATQRGLGLYTDNLELLARLCARSGVRLLFVDQPIHYSACSYSDAKIASVGRMRAGLRGVAERVGLPVALSQDAMDWDGVDVSGDLLLGSNEAVLGRVGYARLAKLLAPHVLAAHASPSLGER